MRLPGYCSGLTSERVYINQHQLIVVLDFGGEDIELYDLFLMGYGNGLYLTSIYELVSLDVRETALRVAKDKWRLAA